MSVSIAHVKGFKIHAQPQTGAYSCLIILPTYLFLFFLNSKAEFVFVNDLLWHVKSHNFKFLAMYLSGNCLKDVTIHPVACTLYILSTHTCQGIRMLVQHCPMGNGLTTNILYVQRSMLFAVYSQCSTFDTGVCFPHLLTIP